MLKLLIILGSTIGSYLGWWIGEAVGGEIVLPFCISAIGAAFGIYLGWKVGKEL